MATLHVLFPAHTDHMVGHEGVDHFVLAGDVPRILKHLSDEAHELEHAVWPPVPAGGFGMWRKRRDRADRRPVPCLGGQGFVVLVALLIAC